MSGVLEQGNLRERLIRRLKRIAVESESETAGESNQGKDGRMAGWSDEGRLDEHNDMKDDYVQRKVG